MIDEASSSADWQGLLWRGARRYWMTRNARVVE